MMLTIQLLKYIQIENRYFKFVIMCHNITVWKPVSATEWKKKLLQLFISWYKLAIVS